MDYEEWSALHLSAGNPTSSRVRGADAERLRNARTNTTGMPFPHHEY